MKQQFAIPAQCTKCETIFDMRYDLQDTGGEEPEYVLDEEIQGQNEDIIHLCWDCRNED